MPVSPNSFDELDAVQVGVIAFGTLCAGGTVTSSPGRAEAGDAARAATPSATTSS